MVYNMKTIINIFNSLTNLYNWEVKRFDIQAFYNEEQIIGYAGYVFLKDGKELTIYDDGCIKERG